MNVYRRARYDSCARLSNVEDAKRGLTKASTKRCAAKRELSLEPKVIGKVGELVIRALAPADMITYVWIRHFAEDTQRAITIHSGSSATLCGLTFIGA
jgi:hypothetical protein